MQTVICLKLVNHFFKKKLQVHLIYVFFFDVAILIHINAFAPHEIFSQLNCIVVVLLKKYILINY